MKKKVFSLMMTLLLAASGFVRADELTVHDGTVTSGFVPVYGFYADAYNRCEMVYPAAELSDMNGGSISSLKFYATQGSVNWGNAIFQVYVAEVASATLGDNFVGQGTNVYQGALSISGNQMVVTFTTPYTYNGGNLLIGIAQTTKGSYVTSTWKGETVNGASISNYNYTSLSDIYSGTQRNFLPKTTFTYTAGTPGGGGGSSDDPEAGLHVVYDNGEARELVIDELYLGEYPAGAWMQPFQFKMYNNDTQALTVSVLDFTPNTDALSMVEGTVLPFTVAANAADSVDLTIQVQAPADAEAGGYEYQFVAIYEGSRLAKIWPLSFTIYTPEIPDVVEKAYDLGTIGDGYTYTGVPSEITPTVLHNDYTLPYPEIPEGNDAVYKFTVEGDMIISAYVDETNADGKVAIYTDDFNGEAGPMATNNYTGFNSNTRNRETLTFDFEDDLQGWTTINVNAAGGTWVHSNNNPGGYDYTDVVHGGTGFAMSYSYVDYDGEYDTDSYLVTPQSYNLGSGASLNFFYDYANDSYPDYFEVCVATTTGAPTAADFTSVWSTARGARGARSTNGVRRSTDRYENWREVTVDLSAYQGQNVWIAFHHEDYDMYEVWIDDVTITGISGGGGGITPTPSPLANVGPVIENMPITAGTYYLVASSTDADYTVYINAADMPCPAIDADGFAFNPQPADDQDSIQPASVTLTWTNPEYATGWRLVFGSTYYPEAGHPQTIIFPEDGSFSTEMANSYTVTNLWNNTNYFWHVEFNNDGACPDGVSSPIWGFTTSFNAPQNLVATPDEIFEGDSTVLTWNAIVDRTYRQYRVYQDGVMIHEFDPTTNPEANLTYTVTGLTYNPTGYVFNVTAVYDEGESDFSNDAIVKVSGFSAEPGIFGYVYEQDSVTPIGGVTVTVTGTDEFGNAVTHSATTNAEGYYSINPVEVGTYATAEATCNGYVSNDTPYTNWPPITIAYQGSWGPMNFILQEEFYPSPLVCAETVQVGDDELVKVWWQIPDGSGDSGNGNGNGGDPGDVILTQDFESGLGDWTIVNGAVGYFSSTGVQQGTTYPAHGGNYHFQFFYTTNPPQYLISPELTGTENGVTVNFFYKAAYATYWVEKFHVGYSTTTNDPAAFTFGEEIISPDVWTEYTNSFPAGTKYVAIKHTANNQFYLFVDDITITAGRGERDMTADRAMHHYRIYRTDCYYEGPYYEGDPGGTVVLASAWVPDTAYFDVSWPDAAPGVYKWGVGVVYEGNQADNPNNPRGELVESPISWGAPVTITRDATADNDPNPVSGEEGVRAPWDLMATFNAPEAAHYGVVTDGQYIYTSNWGYSGADHNFYKYDMQGNMIEGFEIPGCGTLRGMTFDGQYVYGVANSSTVYCVDLNNHTLVNTFTSGFGAAQRGITYDPERDGFWVIGNWTGNLTLINRQGAVQFTGPAPTSVSDLAYYKDENDVEHVFCFNNSDNGVYDYNITTNTLGGSVFNLSVTPGFNSATSGGCHVAEYNGKVAFFGDLQQDPNLIGIYELKEGTVTPTPTPTPGNAHCNNLLALPRESCTAWSNDCSPCIDKDMDIPSIEGDQLVSINVLLNSADPHSPEGTTVKFTNLHEGEQANHPQETITLMDSPFHEFETFRRGTYAIEIAHLGYYTIFDTVNIGVQPNPQYQLRYVMEEILYPAREFYVSYTGFAMWSMESGWENGRNDRHFEYYKVMCTSIDGQPIFNVDVTTPYCQLATDQLTEDETYICKVAAVFSTGISEWRETEWVYRSCENYEGTANGVTINGNVISWDYPGTVTPTPDPTPDPTPGEGLTEGFEGGLGDWTNIDADGDGNVWMTGRDEAHTGTGYAESESYINYVGALTPDNYLVSPQVTLGGTFTFWASAQDPSYAAEKFGVAVSTAGNTNAADFTTLQSWTMTSKSTTSTKAAVRGGTRAGTWYQYSVDLSNYAGQTGYVAIRHYDCTDMFILNVDDIELTTSRNDREDLTYGFETGLEGWTVLTVNAGEGEWLHSSNNPGGYDYTEYAHGGTGFAICYSFVDYVGAYNTNSYLVSPQKYAVGNGSTLNFWADNANDDYPENFSVCVATADNPTAADFTQVWAGGAKGAKGQKAAVRRNNNRYENWREHTIDLSAYAGQEIWIAFHDENYDAYEIWIDDVTITGAGGVTPTPTPTPVEGIIGAAIYQNGQPIDFVMAPTNTWTMPESGEYCVRIIYDGPMDGSYYSMSCEECEGAEVTCTADFTFNGAYDWNEGEYQAHLWWGENGVTPDPTPDPTPGEGFTEGFEGVAYTELPEGWTSIDADGDGNDWYTLNWIEAQWDENVAHGGDTWATSASYASGALYPDNYLVSPQVTLGGTFTFWACAQDPSWAAEKFGVAVSTTGNTNAADFTTLQSWTMTAKATGAKTSDTRSGSNRAGAWYQYTVDLSAYAGQTGYVAIRHYDCSDMFRLNVDDIELNIGRADRSDIVAYNVYSSVDGVNYTQIGTVDAVAGQTYYEYFDNTVTTGNYYYQVTAVFDNGCESAPVLVEGTTNDYLVLNITNVGENNGEVALFPNPTSGNVKIMANAMRHITVVSVLGQVVYDTDVNTDEMDLNMGQWNAGVYVVRIVTETGTHTQRVTVVR